MLNEMEQHIYHGNLVEIYGRFLTDKQRKYMELYFLNDWSLAEIAEEFAVSRTTIHTQIQTSIKKITEFEDALHVSYLQNTFMQDLQNAVDAEDMDKIKKIMGTLNEKIDRR